MYLKKTCFLLHLFKIGNLHLGGGATCNVARLFGDNSCFVFIISMSPRQGEKMETHYASVADPDPYVFVGLPHPLFRGWDPRIRIRTKMSRIRNTAVQIFFLG
jgi:hypothetical protein